MEMPAIKPMTDKDIERIIKKQGWVLDRDGGRHKVFKKPGQPKSIILRHHNGMNHQFVVKKWLNIAFGVAQ